jgi:hypothetical protein
VVPLRGVGFQGSDDFVIGSEQDLFDEGALTYSVVSGQSLQGAEGRCTDPGIESVEAFAVVTS